jgi:putative oxidoreductase
MSSSLITLGRVMLGLFFVAAGVLQFIGVTDAGGLAPLAEYISAHGLPAATILAGAVIVFQILAGVAILLDRYTISAGFLLALFCLATALLFHRFWAVPADQITGQLYHFMKNIGLAGAFILLAGDKMRYV